VDVELCGRLCTDQYNTRLELGEDRRSYDGDRSSESPYRRGTRYEMLPISNGHGALRAGPKRSSFARIRQTADRPSVAHRWRPAEMDPCARHECEASCACGNRSRRGASDRGEGGTSDRKWERRGWGRRRSPGALFKSDVYFPNAWRMMPISDSVSVRSHTRAFPCIQRTTDRSSVSPSALVPIGQWRVCRAVSSVAVTLTGRPGADVRPGRLRATRNCAARRWRQEGARTDPRSSAPVTPLRRQTR
jgi:hypothetical protein